MSILRKLYRCLQGCLEDVSNIRRRVRSGLKMGAVTTATQERRGVTIIRPETILAYSPPYVDRIWLREYYNKIPIYAKFYRGTMNCLNKICSSKGWLRSRSRSNPELYMYA